MRPSKRSRDQRPRNNLQRLRKQANLSQEHVAEAVGVSYSMISRYERGLSQMNEDMLTKFTTFYKVPPEAILNVESQISTTLVKGAAESGKWVMAVEWAQKDWYAVSSPPLRKFPDLPRFGIEMRGEAMNEIYPAGSVLICIRMNHLRAHKLKHGERVIVDRIRDEDESHEIGCWEYRRDPSGLEWLWPRSDRPEHQTPLLYDRETITVVALVVGYFRED